MDGESPKTPTPPAPEINAEWIYEAYQQQQRTNAMILQLLQNQQNQKQNLTPSFPQSHTPADLDSRPITTPATRPKHTLPQPEYTHEDPALYPQFRGLIAQKLRVDALACGDTDYDRVWYGFACLKGIAASRIFSWIDYAQKSGVTFVVQDFLTQLDVAFSDPQKTQKAISKINQIRQGRTPFREFLQEFEQTLLEAGGWGWDDIVRKGYLKAGINYKLKSLLVSQIEPSSYTDYVNLLRLTSDNFEALDRSSWPSRPPTTSEPMEWQPTSASRGSVFVSKEIQELRRKAGQCLKCGLPGHHAHACRKGWTVPQSKQQQKTTVSNVQEGKAVEEVQSGKE
jgi:hypothetical protein